MAGVVLCEATDLYNILNQGARVSSLAESNYLLLIGKPSKPSPSDVEVEQELCGATGCVCVFPDARTKQEYDESHVLMAKRSKRDANGDFVIPACVEVESMRYCVVYDGHAGSVEDCGPAAECAAVLEQCSRNPVQILRGGYEDFSACYPFLRTQKILYSPQELEELRPHPVEILPGRLYMGDRTQASDQQVLKDLKIKALVDVSGEPSSALIGSGCEVLASPPADSVEEDLSGFFQEACRFTDVQLGAGASVLLFSCRGVSHCSAMAMAFLIHHLRCTLQEAWAHMLKCKNNMRPNRGFVQQLSAWERAVLGEERTDISEPSF
ncbi:serine/threonine/tyrosine-interacting-like protein 1 isoform X2 [Amia ocellicauda]